MTKIQINNSTGHRFSQGLLIFIVYLSGGLTAVIWTDLIQTIIMLVGATVLMIRGKYPLLLFL